MSAITLDELLSVAEAAELAGLSQEAIRRACRIGTLDAEKVGNGWIMTRDALARYTAYTSQKLWMMDPRRRPGRRRR